MAETEETLTYNLSAIACGPLAGSIKVNSYVIFVGGLSPFRGPGCVLNARGVTQDLGEDPRSNFQDPEKFQKPNKPESFEVVSRVQYSATAFSELLGAVKQLT